MASEVRFVVYGTPKPQGSTRAFIPKGWARAVITTDNKKLKPWRQEISGMAKNESRPEAWMEAQPLIVHLYFFLAKPKSTKRARPTTKPDIDKLARGVLDSLTGILFRDDSQVVGLRADKHYDSVERVEIVISEAI